MSKPRKLPKGGRVKLSSDVDPSVLIDNPDLCGGNFPFFYEAGIDYYCDGTASRAGRRHNPQTVAEFRWFTCERATTELGESVPWWMKGRSIEEKDAPGRLILDCPRCTFERSMAAARVTELYQGLYREHARRVERRNVTTLLH